MALKLLIPNIPFIKTWSYDSSFPFCQFLKVDRNLKHQAFSQVREGHMGTYNIHTKPRLFFQELGCGARSKAKHCSYFEEVQ